MLIEHYHISPDYAIHIYTGWIYDCDYFLVHDERLLKRIPSKAHKGLQIMDLASAADRDYLESKLTFH
jgi:hypothetical protein